MSLHLNLSTGKFLNSSTLFKLSDALLLDVSSGEIVMSNLLVPRAGVDLFKLASLDLNFAQRKSLTDRVSGNNLVTFSRASTGTYVDSDGLIKTSPVNLLTYSEQFDQWDAGSNTTITTNAIAAPDGSMTADRIELPASGGTYIQQTNVITAGAEYTGSVWVKAVTPGINNQFNLQYGGNSASSTAFTATGDWQRISSTVTAALGGPFSINNRPDTYITDVYIWGAQLEEGSTASTYIPTTSTISGAPRFDHDPVTGESLGLLIEESRTNLAKYSEQFDQGFWVKLSSNTSVTPNATTAPDGTNSADLVTAAATTALNGSLVYQVFGNQSNKDLVGSIYVKSSGSASTARFFVNGDVGADRQILDVTLTNEWQRVVLPVFNTTQASVYIHVKPGDDDNQIKSFYIWGAQLEEGSFATSYIPTTSSTVTRAADVASITGTNFSSWYNQSEGTVFADVTGEAGFGYTINDGSNSHRHGLAVSTGQPFVNTPTSVSFGTAPTVVSGGGLVSYAYKANDYGAFGNGTVLVGTSPTNVPVGLEELALGFRGSYQANSFLNGHIARLAYFPTRKSDQDLITITDGTLAPAIITYGITSTGGTFNLLSTGTVDYAVDWDSTGGYETSTLNTLPHTYTAGDYDLVVYSDGVYRPYFNNVTADASQITSVAIGSGADLGTLLTRAWYGASNMTTFTCPFDVTSSVTDFNYAWRVCTNLTSFPLLDTSSGTSFGGAWRDCTSLTSFPLLNTSSGTNFSRAWQNCINLTSFPLLNTSSGATFSYAWYSCSNLTSFPLLNTSSGTSFSNAWRYCINLTSFPLLNTSSGANFSYAWYNCNSLTSFPLLNTSSGTTFSYAWYSCSSLTSFPLLNTSSGISFNQAWQSCTSLTSFPLLNTSSGTNFGFGWYNCTSLTDFPANMFDTTGTLIATAFTSAWRDCALTAQSIENILTSLDTNGATGVTLGINGGTNAAKTTWSTAAVTAYDNLIVKGWTIAFNA